MRRPSAAWADDPLWATFYDWTVEHPRRRRRSAGGSACGSDLRPAVRRRRRDRPAAGRARGCSTSRAAAGSRCAGCGPGRASTYVAADIAQAMLDRTMARGAAARRRRPGRAAAGRRRRPAVRGRVVRPGRHVHRPALLPRPATARCGDGAGAPARRRAHRQRARQRHRRCATSRCAGPAGGRSLLGPMCSRAERGARGSLRTASPTCGSPRAARIAYFRGVKRMSRFPPGVPDRRLGARRASRSARRRAPGPWLPARRARPARTPGTCCAPRAGGSVTSGGTRRPTIRCRSRARWPGSATSWRPRLAGVAGPVLVVGKSLGTYGARLAAERVLPGDLADAGADRPGAGGRRDPRQPGPAAARRRHRRPPLGRRRRGLPGRRRVRRTPARRHRPRPHRPRRPRPLRRRARRDHPRDGELRGRVCPLRDGCNVAERSGIPGRPGIATASQAQCRRSPSESSAMLARSSPWPSVLARSKDAWTSASASARPTQLAPSTDLPGSRSL